MHPIWLQYDSIWVRAQNLDYIILCPVSTVRRIVSARAQRLQLIPFAFLSTMSELLISESHNRHFFRSLIIVLHNTPISSSGRYANSHFHL